MIEHFTQFWQSQTSRLMLVYLGIIMVMSLCYSLVIYSTSAAQLERQLPTNTGYIDANGQFLPAERVGSYLRLKIAEGKQELIVSLYILNLVMLVFGAAFSYILARWTLDPIERSVRAQTRFVSDASHELRTPLTAIQTTNEVALRKPKLSAKEAREVLQSNLDDVQRLQRMTSTMLDLVAEDRPLMTTPVHVHDIVTRSLTDVAPRAIERDITVDDKTENVVVQADMASATQALTILLDNAVKYSDEGSTVTLKTERLKRGSWALSVVDTGPGIARDEQKLIFTRFYRSDEARSRQGTGGYGLGLEIAQMIARRHNGSIELDSKPGRGSTFSLVLPASKS